jgi:predicted nucleic acid-binding protein
MTDKPAPIFLDTNILVRFALKSAPFHQEIRKVIGDFWKDNVDLWISRQVMREMASVITRPQTYARPLTSQTAAQEIRALPASFFVADETIGVSDKLLELMEQHPMGGKQVHDANIVATMQVHGITRLFTLNTADFMRFSKLITVITLEELLSS